MISEISLQGEKIEYEHKLNRRAKKIRLAIHPGGEIKVTTPFGVPESFVLKFMQAKAKWILTKLEHQKKLPKREIINTTAEYNKHKDNALKMITQRLEFFNQHYGYTYNRISIKNHRSRWGSCSKRGNL